MSTWIPDVDDFFAGFLLFLWIFFVFSYWRTRAWISILFLPHMQHSFRIPSVLISSSVKVKETLSFPFSFRDILEQHSDINPICWINSLLQHQPRSRHPLHLQIWSQLLWSWVWVACLCWLLRHPALPTTMSMTSQTKKVTKRRKRTRETSGDTKTGAWIGQMLTWCNILLTKDLEEWVLLIYLFLQILVIDFCKLRLFSSMRIASYSSLSSCFSLGFPCASPSHHESLPFHYSRLFEARQSLEAFIFRPKRALLTKMEYSTKRYLISQIWGHHEVSSEWSVKTLCHFIVLLLKYVFFRIISWSMHHTLVNPK